MNQSQITPAKRKGKSKQYARDLINRHNARHPKRKKSRNKITNMVRDGKLKQPKGKEFHHTDYKNNKVRLVEKSKHRAIKRLRK